MLTIQRFYFLSAPEDGSKTDWAGRGEGSVRIEHDGDIVRFYESGHFALQSAQPSQTIPFSNVYRWSFFADRVSLHHERRGADAAVWLFDLVTSDNDGDVLISDQAHVCVDDLYAARLTIDSDGFHLDWTITGPRKNERLHYRYLAASTTSEQS